MAAPIIGGDYWLYHLNDTFDKWELIDGPHPSNAGAFNRLNVLKPQYTPTMWRVAVTEKGSTPEKLVSECCAGRWRPKS
jgi:hypothetical protein